MSHFELVFHFELKKCTSTLAYRIEDEEEANSDYTPQAKKSHQQEHVEKIRYWQIKRSFIRLFDVVFSIADKGSRPSDGKLSLSSLSTQR